MCVSFTAKCFLFACATSNDTRVHAGGCGTGEKLCSFSNQECMSGAAAKTVSRNGFRVFMQNAPGHFLPLGTALFCPLKDWSATLFRSMPRLRLTRRTGKRKHVRMRGTGALAFTFPRANGRWRAGTAATSRPTTPSHQQGPGREHAPPAVSSNHADT